MYTILNDKNREYINNVVRIKKYEKSKVLIIIADSMEELKEIKEHVKIKLLKKDGFIIATNNLSCEFIIGANDMTKYIVFMNSNILEEKIKEQIKNINKQIKKEV